MREVRLGKHRGVFCVVWYDESGHRHRRSLGTADRQRAATGLATFRASLAAATPSGPITIDTIFNAYIDDRRTESISTARMESAWKRLQPHFGHIRPGDIGKNDASAYTRARLAAGVGNGTIWNELVYLRAALEFAVREKWLTKAPYIKVPRKPSPKTDHLTKAEAKRLIEAAQMPHVKLFIRLALATAGRASALLELTWDRVDLETRRIFLRDPEVDATRKGRATVPINDSLLATLQEARRAALSPYVIEWGGDRVMSIKKGVGAAASRAGVKCSPHVLRHTAAVWMAESGISMDKVAQYLGHDDARTTSRVYARFSPDFMRDAADALEL